MGRGEITEKARRTIWECFWKFQAIKDYMRSLLEETLGINLATRRFGDEFAGESSWENCCEPIAVGIWILKLMFFNCFRGFDLSGSHRSRAVPGAWLGVSRLVSNLKLNNLFQPWSLPLPLVQLFLKSDVVIGEKNKALNSLGMLSLGTLQRSKPLRVFGSYQESRLGFGVQQYIQNSEPKSYFSPTQQHNAIKDQI